MLDVNNGKMEFVSNVPLDITSIMIEYVHKLMIIVLNGKLKLVNVENVIQDMFSQEIDVL